MDAALQAFVNEGLHLPDMATSNPVTEAFETRGNDRSASYGQQSNMQYRFFPYPNVSETTPSLSRCSSLAEFINVSCHEAVLYKADAILHNSNNLGIVCTAPFWENIRGMAACRDPPAESPASPMISLQARAAASLMLLPQRSQMPGPAEGPATAQ